MSLTSELSEMAMQIRDGDDTPHTICEEDVQAARLLLLDALGCGLAGIKADGCRAVIEQMRDWGGKAEAMLLIEADRLPAHHAAFANSVLIHAQDLDDIYIPGTLHISSMVVPAMLACAEVGQTTGREALRALIMGVEVAARIENVGRGHRRGLGFLPSSLAGSFGAVITGAMLLGLDAEQCTQALGINYAQLSGNRQALYDSTLTKRMQPANAVRNAIWSVMLAQRGITGPTLALEGDAGYYQLYLDLPSPPASGTLTQPNDVMQIQRVAFKRFPSCGGNHSMQLAAEQLVREEQINPDDIANVQLFGMKHGGMVSRDFQIGSNPQVDAQFNVAWAVAHTLLRGPAKLADYHSDRVAADRQVIELAQAITYIDSPEQLPPPLPMPEGYNAHHIRWQGLIVTMKDGKQYTRHHCPVLTFAPGNMDQDQITAKFHDSAAYSEICTQQQAQYIVDAVMQLDQSDSINDLLKSLCFSKNTFKEG